MKNSFTLDLRRTSRVNRMGSKRTIRLLEAASDQSPEAVKAAEKLVAACRENVRFLNRHLKPYRAWIDLPALVDNVLYLAYTVTVKKTAPFRSDELRQTLVRAGIEAPAQFSFDRGIPDDRDGDDTTFCLPCHRYLTIRDMEYIIDTLETFFDDVRHSRIGLKSDEKREDPDAA